jgi:hypothetical protein
MPIGKNILMLAHMTEEALATNAHLTPEQLNGGAD